jgi:hypothetical protein
MSFINQLFERFFPSPQRLKPGIYHYQAPQEDPRNYRLHLRVENNGQGVLIVNASTVLHLNETAAEYAYHLIQHTLKKWSLRMSPGATTSQRAGVSRFPRAAGKN